MFHQYPMWSWQSLTQLVFCVIIFKAMELKWNELISAIKGSH